MALTIMACKVRLAPLGWLSLLRAAMLAARLRLPASCASLEKTMLPGGLPAAAPSPNTRAWGDH